MLTGDFRPLEYDPSIPDPVGWRHTNHQKHYSAITIYDNHIIYHVKYSYENVIGLTDIIARTELSNGFAYIIENHIDRAKGGEIRELKELFEAYNYPLLSFVPMLSLAGEVQVNINLGDRDDFLAFIEQLKQEDTLPVMPTEPELLQFLNGGEPDYD